MTGPTNLSNQNHLPALTGSIFWRYFTFIALYIAQGIPEGMLFYGIPAWMAANGKTPGEIGSIVAISGLPWSFKIIVAPMMDRFTYLPMGRRRPWIIFGQLGLILSFAGMAFIPDPLNNMSWLMTAAFTVSCFGAFQDVATDGMAVDVIPIKQQARANGFMWGSKIGGIAASLAIGTFLLNNYGFKASILALSFMVALVMLVPLLLRERPGEKLLPWLKGKAAEESSQIQTDSWKNIFRSLGKVVMLKNSLFLTAVSFLMMVAFNFLDTLLPVFTVQALGWTNEEYSQLYAVAGSIGAVGGMLIGGFMIDKFGKIRMMNIYFFLSIILTFALVLCKSYWSSKALITVFMLTYQMLYVFATIGLFAAAMQCCWKKVSATQFTFYMTIGNLGRVVGAKLLGPLKEQFSWEYTVLAFAVLLAIAWLALRFSNIVQQEKRVAEIDEAELVRLAPVKASADSFHHN